MVLATVAASAAMAAASPVSAGSEAPDVARYLVLQDVAANGFVIQSVSPDSVVGQVGGTVIGHLTGGVVAELASADADVVALYAGVRLLVDEPVRILESQPSAEQNWGRDRLDQTRLPLDGRYDVAVDGAGVEVFMIDTGLDADHVEFVGRVGEGADFVGDGKGTADCNGHGTHTSSVAAGATTGAAAGATVRPLRVLDCDGAGWTSGVVSAIDWAIEHATGPSVINMSIGGNRSDAIDHAVERATRHGIVVVAAAGNGGADACDASPSGSPTALTVGASTRDDEVAWFSDVGPCVDLFAPGVGLMGAWAGTDSLYRTASGTSQASPLVAGLAALVLERHPEATPDAVTDLLFEASTSGVMADVPAGTPDRLARVPDGLVSDPGDERVRFTPEVTWTSWGWAGPTSVWVMVGFEGEPGGWVTVVDEPVHEEPVHEEPVPDGADRPDTRFEVGEDGRGLVALVRPQGSVELRLNGGTSVEVALVENTEVRDAVPEATMVAEIELEQGRHLVGYEVATAGPRSVAELTVRSVDPGGSVWSTLTDREGRAWMVLPLGADGFAVTVAWTDQTVPQEE